MLCVKENSVPEPTRQHLCSRGGQGGLQARHERAVDGPIVHEVHLGGGHTSDTESTQKIRNCLPTGHFSTCSSSSTAAETRTRARAMAARIQALSLPNAPPPTHVKNTCTVAAIASGSSTDHQRQPPYFRRARTPFANE